MPFVKRGISMMLRDWRSVGSVLRRISLGTMDGNGRRFRRILNGSGKVVILPFDRKKAREIDFVRLRTKIRRKEIAAITEQETNQQITRNPNPKSRQNSCSASRNST